MTAPSLMFEHGLDVLKGWFQPSALDFSAKLSDNVTFDVPAGRVMHVNAAGELETGVGETDMGLFLIQGSTEFDVSNPGTTPAGNFLQQAIAPTGVMTGLVATGGYEIESTEFDTDQEYTQGDLLTAAVANSTLATGGVLTNVGSGGAGDVEQFVDPVCGVVSRGSYNNCHGIAVVAFWSVWLPGAYPTS